MSSKTKTNCITALVAAGITEPHAQPLRRISMVLHRWHELQCGNGNGECIERNDETGIAYLTYDTGRNGMHGRTKIADRETAAIKRLAKIKG